jgi:hypothetical protein
MSGISIAFAVAGCALFGVALLFIFGLFAIGLSLTADAVPGPREGRAASTNAGHLDARQSGR